MKHLLVTTFHSALPVMLGDRLQTQSLVPDKRRNIEDPAINAATATLDVVAVGEDYHSLPVRLLHPRTACPSFQGLGQLGDCRSCADIQFPDSIYHAGNGVWHRASDFTTVNIVYWGDPGQGVFMVELRTRRAWDEPILVIKGRG